MGDPTIPGPRQPLLIEQDTPTSVLRAMITHAAAQADSVDFAALPATIRCEILLAVADLSAALTAAAHKHPAVKP